MGDLNSRTKRDEGRTCELEGDYLSKGSDTCLWGALENIWLLASISAPHLQFESTICIHRGVHTYSQRTLFKIGGSGHRPPKKTTMGTSKGRTKKGRQKRPELRVVFGWFVFCFLSHEIQACFFKEDLLLFWLVSKQNSLWYFRPPSLQIHSCQSWFKVTVLPELFLSFGVH